FRTPLQADHLQSLRPPFIVEPASRSLTSSECCECCVRNGLVEVAGCGPADAQRLNEACSNATPTGVEARKEASQRQIQTVEVVLAEIRFAAYLREGLDPRSREL